jgi:hypothetical protein
MHVWVTAAGQTWPIASGKPALTRLNLRPVPSAQAYLAARRLGSAAVLGWQGGAVSWRLGAAVAAGPSRGTITHCYLRPCTSDPCTPDHVHKFTAMQVANLSTCLDDW